ncbi:MAG: Asp-tRNA(Asn)/Glu-tRNA(Gln) amidotransferase GatCAB subunit A, partial [Betaproteobacteria bacterium]|nr:Asp-tRNA(Asn)/Glu-tRNA(Gln) amidotransferase GatCAB subunit A [Betaproteobacteria bacterium]
MGVGELAQRLRAREVSALELAQHFLSRAQAQAALGAFVALDAEATLAQARAADARLAAGEGADSAPL